MTAAQINFVWVQAVISNGKNRMLIRFRRIITVKKDNSSQTQWEELSQVLEAMPIFTLRRLIRQGFKESRSLIL